MKLWRNYQAWATSELQGLKALFRYGFLMWKGIVTTIGSNNQPMWFIKTLSYSGANQSESLLRKTTHFPSQGKSLTDKYRVSSIEYRRTCQRPQFDPASCLEASGSIQSNLECELDSSYDPTGVSSGTRARDWMVQPPFSYS